MDSAAPWSKRLKRERIARNWRQHEVAEMLGTTVASVSRWERGSHEPSAYFRLKLCALFQKSAEELGFISDQNLFAEKSETTEAERVASPSTSVSPFLWNVPYPRNPCFTGREETLLTVHTHLASLQPIALSGLGGIGKTQVAVEYAHRYAQEYKAVFWLAGETPERLTTCMQQIADLLQLPERQAAEPSRMLTAVQHWLATHAGWLMIVDHIEDLDSLLAILPPVRPGALLLTTRGQAMGTWALSLELPPMSSEEGTSLLVRRIYRSAPSLSGTPPAPEPLTYAHPPSGTVELVQLLQGLPLALDQAGAYIEEIGCHITDYIQRYREQRKQVLAHRGIHGGGHPDSVAATLGLAVKHVERKHPLAPNLLRLCAFLHPEMIPEELLQVGASCVGFGTASATADSYQFDQALAALRSASLVTRQGGGRTLSVHRLVQIVLQDQMESEEIRVWGKRVVCTLNMAFPDGAFETWSRCERCVVHVLACLPLIAQVGGELSEAGELLYKTGSYLLGCGRQKEARPLLEQAVELEERREDPNYSVLIARLVKLAEWFWRRGKYEETERLARHALELGERFLGSNHPQVAEALYELGFLFWYQGNYIQAEPLYQRAVRIWERQLGSEHLKTATGLQSLGDLFRDQGRYGQAEPLYQRALSLQEQQLGCEHPQVARTLSALATLYRQQGRDERAEQFYQHALQIQEQRLGREHPETALPLAGWAHLCQIQGNYEQAALLYQRALSVREHQLGPEHPWVVSLHDALATVPRE